MQWQQIADPLVRAIFEAAGKTGCIEFTHAEETSIDTYYFFRWKTPEGDWEDAMLPSTDIIHAMGTR